ncbi:MAG: amidohydrolase, partial [Thermomicrobiales bacterium]
MTSGFISVDDHVLETPDVWTSRMSKKTWGDRIPHLARGSDGRDQWLVDGKVAFDGSVAGVGAFMADRNDEPRSWDEVPAEAYD